MEDFYYDVAKIDTFEEVDENGKTIMRMRIRFFKDGFEVFQEEQSDVACHLTLNSDK